MKESSRLVLKVLFYAFSAALIWITLVANTGGNNFILKTVDSIPNGDKIGHFFVMGFLAYLANLVMECRSFKIGRINILTASAIVAIFVVLDEMTHIFIRTRTFSYLDLLSDFLGILAFSLLAIRTQPAISTFLDKLWPGFTQRTGSH